MEVGEGNCAFARRSARPGDPGLALTMREYFDGSADDKAQAHAEYVEYVPESFEDGRTNDSGSRASTTLIWTSVPAFAARRPRPPALPPS